MNDGGVGAFARAAGLYALLLALVYLPVVFLGRTLSPEAYQPFGVTEHGPAGDHGRTAVSTFDVDLGTPAYHEAPINRLVGAMLRAGEPPLWNPYQGLGGPLAAQYSTRALFPYQWLQDLAPATWTDAFLLGRTWLAALLTFGFLRRLSLSHDGAFLGGLFYALSGAFAWFINLEQMTNVGMVLPAFTWACEIIATTAGGPGIVFAGVTAGLVLLAGQPETAAVALLFGACWVVFRGWRTGALGAAFGRGVVAALIGACVAAPLLLPFAELYFGAFHLHGPDRMSGLQSTPSSLAIGILTPSWFQRPVHPVGLPTIGHWDLLGGYTGVTVPVLVVASIARWRFRLLPEAAVLASSGIVLVLKVFGVPPFAWIGALPVLNVVFFQRWAGPIWCFAFAAAAAVCCDALANPAASRLERRRATGDVRWPQVAELAGYACLAGVYVDGITGPVLRPTIDLAKAVEYTLADYTFPSRVLGVSVSAACIGLVIAVTRGGMLARPLFLAVGLVAVAELWYGVPQGLAPGPAAARVGVPLLLLGAAVASSRGITRVAAGLCGAAAVYFAGLDLSVSRGLPDRLDPYAEPAWVPWLREHVGSQRVTGLDGVLAPNTASALALRDVHFVSALAPKATVEVTQASLNWLDTDTSFDLWLTGAPSGIYPDPPGLKGLAPRLRAYSLFGVRYVVVPRDARAGRAGIPPELVRVYHEDVDIYENTAALPRAWVVQRVLRAPDDAAAITAAILDPTFDPRRAALGDVDRELAPAGAPLGTAQVTLDEAHRVTVSVDGEAAGMLVLADSWYSAWEATVDGEPAPIERVDGCLRGVVVPAGPHVVDFTYSMAAFKLGVALAACGALACVGVWRRGGGPAEVRR